MDFAMQEHELQAIHFYVDKHLQDVSSNITFSQNVANQALPTPRNQ